MSFASVATFLHMASSGSPGSSASNAKILENQCVNSATGKIVECATKNFLIPNGTFFFEWIVFIGVLVFLAKKVVPRLITMIDGRQATIAKQFQDAEDAKTRLESAEQEYKDALAETRRDASRLREQAQAERAAIVEEARGEAQTRVDEMLNAASERMATERQQAILSLRNEIGELATTLAERVVHDSLREDARQRKLVSDFIAGVGASETASASATGESS